MTIQPTPVHAAVIGAGMAGAACAAGLRAAGVHVTCFDKSRHVGGRLATRRAEWVGEDGVANAVAFDHGASCITALRPRFRAAMARAVARGHAVEWKPLVHASRSALSERCFVATPSMPALCSHLLDGATLHLNATVQRLQRAAGGLWYVAVEGAPLAGPFHQVVVALPPAQAAVLLAGYHDAWASALMQRRMEPCWTLMAVSDDVDWPWDAAEPDHGPLAIVTRNDRVPGRAPCSGLAVWTAHATAEWSAIHLDDEPHIVRDALRRALAAQLPATTDGATAVRWHHAAVHRWRYAGPSVDCDDSFDADDALWDPRLGLGVCGDWLGGGGVEAAWHSGDELADHMAASFDHVDAIPELAAAVG